MSTRRARIKAVTSLPPRRKNNGNETKGKLSSEKSAKSPRPTLEEKKSPRALSVPDCKLTENITNNNVVGTPVAAVIFNKSATPEISPKEAANTIPLTPEKLRTPACKNITTVFVSPAKRDSPKKTFASPIAPSPKVAKNSELQKLSNLQNRSTPTAQKISENNELQIAERIVSKIDHNIEKSKKDNTKDDFNIPSVPESLNDEAMDGIVPLQPTASIPKPIDILKSEIISENAEVLFDPIIPLPSPSKVRPKLRPVPRLDRIHRRNSVQGSASESEDESRRGILNSRDRQTHEVHTLQSLPNRDVSRVRNDSVCSSVSQVTNQPPQPASPVKERHIPKTRRQEEARRRMAMRKRKENTKREALTMYDLIFYNPTSNPLVPNEDELKVKEANEKNEAERLSQEKEVGPLKPQSPEKTPEAAPVPQIKLGPKGEIILDEQSLVIKRTESDRQVSSVVHEGASGVSGGNYRKYNFCRSLGWTAPETVRFYRALAALGTDFTLMAQLFPNRTRKQLKVKFKREEKVNGAQIDKALRATLQFDVAQLKKEFEDERVLAARQAELDRERLNNEKQAERERIKAAKDVRIRQSRGSKALEAALVPKHKDAINTDDIIEHSIKARKRKPIPKTLTANPKLPLVNLARRTSDMATSKPSPPALQVKTPDTSNPVQVPTNIETGSLVVLTVNDPSSPAKKMLQTYIASGSGKLTPVALPPTFLNCVVGYMKKGTPKGSTVSSPQLLSPSSVTSHDSHSSAPAGISILPSPAKRQRHSSYTITQL